MYPRTTAEQRGRFYEDVEALISPGFLTHPVEVAGVRLHMRSLGSGDLFMLRARTQGTSGRDWRVWAVATSIWMVNGRVVLGQDEAIPFLADYIQRLPDTALGILFSTILGLWVRVGDAIEDVEVFIYEPVSRYKWKSMGGHLLHSGVPGADALGLNTIQRIWTAFNEMEDSRRSDETAWEGFKLVASSNAPKAVLKIDEKDRQRRASEQAMRQRRLDEFFYVKLGVMTRRPTGEQAETQSFRIASKTVEDLEDEMRRWVEDDPDVHDRVVRDYKDRIRAQHAREQEEREARRHALLAERNRIEVEALESDYTPPPLVALTGAQLQQLLRDRQKFGHGARFIPTHNKAEAVYQRHLSDGAVTSGNLRVSDGRVQDPNANLEVDVRTLNELVKGRHPTFGSGG